MMFANIPMFFSSLLRRRLQQCRSSDDDDDESAARCSRNSSYTALLEQARQQLKDLDGYREAEDVSSTEDCSDVSIDFLKRWEQRIPIQRSKTPLCFNKNKTFKATTTPSTSLSSSSENDPIAVKTKESHLQRTSSRDSNTVSNRSLPVIPFYSLRDHLKDETVDQQDGIYEQQQTTSERNGGFAHEGVHVCRIPEHIEFPSDWCDKDESNAIVLDPIDPIYYGDLPSDLEHLEPLADEMLKLLHEHLLHPEIDTVASRLAEFIESHPTILCQIKYPPPTHQDAVNEQLCYPLAFASVTGHLSVINAALSAYPEAMRPDPHLGTPAHYAAYHRASAAAMRELCHAAPEAVKSTNRRHHHTPLHLACAAPGLRHETDIVVQSLDRASATTVATTPSTTEENVSSDDESSPSVATTYAVPNLIDFECVKVLVSYYPTAILLPDRQGWTPLHYACQALHAPVVQYFCELHPTAARATTITGQTPLHIAVSVTTCCSESSVLSVVEILLHAYPAGAYSMDHIGQTALHKAVLFARQRKRVIELLLQANPSAMHVPDEEGILPEQLLRNIF